ncbi:MAG: hypothetical protein K8T20_14205 [Planctomycetes bacterium]|nr:hypothetical protein [Planctomycetota bacterium]
MRVLTVFLVLALAVFAEDATPPKSDAAAEELVKKIEAKVASAKTFSMKGTMVVAAGEDKQSFEVAMDFKDGNRARMQVDGKGPDGKTAFTLTVVCDGKRVARGDPDGMEVEDADADLAQKARDLAVRAPIRDLTQTLGGKAPKKPLVYSDFAFAADEKIGDRSARVVTYAASRGSVRLQMKLWIDAEKIELLKRETLEKKKDVETRVTDTFSAMAVDGEIKDETFAVPDEKGGGEPKEEK